MSISKSAIFWLNEEYLCKNCIFFLTDINFGCASRAILDKFLNFWTVWGGKTFFADTLTLNRIICYILLGSGVSWAFLMWFFYFFVCFVGLIHITYRDQNILIPLFKSLVRPVLEYGNAVWNNGIKKCMNKIENVQRKLTKHVKGMQHLSYKERLKRTKLPSLEYRQMRGDLIQVYKIANDIYDPVSTNSIFEFTNNERLRGHKFKINKQQVNKTKY